MSSALAWRRLLLGGRREPTAVDGLLRRLGQADAPRPLAFETEAQSGSFGWFAGTAPTRLDALRTLTTDFLGARLVPIDKADRLTTNTVKLIVLRRLPVPLDAERSEAVVAALYSAFTRLRGDERLRLQVVLGRGHAPHLSPLQASLGSRGTLDALLYGAPDPATGRMRARLEERAALPSVEVSIRIGVSADHPARRQELALDVYGALRLLETAGTELKLAPAKPTDLDDAREALVRRSRLTTPELVPLLALPLGNDDLPGLPLHPRRPLAPAKLEAKQNVFARLSTPGDERPIGMPTSALLQHVVVSGPTNSGKSNVLTGIADQLIRARVPLAFLDPKRQAIDHLLARLPRSAAGRVVVLDVSDQQLPVGFNPLDTAGRNADVVVDGVLASLRAIFEDGWGPRTEDLLFGSLRSLSLAGERRSEPYTLIDLPRILTDTRFRRSVTGQIGDDPVLATFWAAFEDLRDGARANMIAAPLNKLRKFMLRPNLVAALGQPRPRFRVRDLFAGESALLVPLNDALIGPGSAQLLGSLLVAELFLAAQERAREADPRERPGVVIVDEAQRFVHLPTALDDALATSRSYGVGWIAAHQYRDQLSPTLRAGFDANATSKIVFRSRVKDARDYAAMSPDLEPNDFMALERYEFYTTLAGPGEPSPWFAARALPPKPELGNAELIRETSRERFGAPPAELPVADEASEPPSSAARGRKPRQP